MVAGSEIECLTFRAPAACNALPYFEYKLPHPARARAAPQGWFATNHERPLGSLCICAVAKRMPSFQYQEW